MTAAAIAIGGRLCNPAIAELATRHAWVCWRVVHRQGKPTKPPFTPACAHASSTDRTTWSSFDEWFAAAYVHGRHRGIGRVLVPDEGLVGIDLDEACAADGTIAPWAHQIIQALSMPESLVKDLAKTHPQLRRILERQYPSLSERDLALVRFAKLARWEPSAAWAFVRAVRTDGKSDRPDYAARTLALVY